MKVQEIMERANINETGRAIAYIKDALDEMAIESPTHTKTVRMDVVLNQRFYKIPTSHKNGWRLWEGYGFYDKGVGVIKTSR